MSPAQEAAGDRAASGDCSRGEQGNACLSAPAFGGFAAVGWLCSPPFGSFLQTAAESPRIVPVIREKALDNRG